MPRKSLMDATKACLFLPIVDGGFRQFFVSRRLSPSAGLQERLVKSPGPQVRPGFKYSNQDTHLSFPNHVAPSNHPARNGKLIAVVKNSPLAKLQTHRIGEHT